MPGRLREIIADTLNTSAAQIGRLDAIGKNLIPEFQEEIKEKRLGISTAYEISGLSEERQKEALEEYREKGSFSISDARQRKESRTVAESGTRKDKSAINDTKRGTVRSHPTANDTKSGTVQETLESLCAYCKDMDKAGDTSRDWATDASALGIVIAGLKYEKK